MLDKCCTTGLESSTTGLDYIVEVRSIIQHLSDGLILATQPSYSFWKGTVEPFYCAVLLLWHDVYLFSISPTSASSVSIPTSLRSGRGSSHIFITAYMLKHFQLHYVQKEGLPIVASHLQRVPLEGIWQFGLNSVQKPSHHMLVCAPGMQVANAGIAASKQFKQAHSALLPLICTLVWTLMVGEEMQQVIDTRSFLRSNI